jgi:hypothetical protein
MKKTTKKIAKKAAPKKAKSPPFRLERFSGEIRMEPYEGLDLGNEAAVDAFLAKEGYPVEKEPGK